MVMTTTAAIITELALAAAAAGTSYYNSEKTAKRQDNALAQNIRDQMQKQQEAADRTNKTLTQLKASSPDTSQQNDLAKYTQQLQQHERAMKGAIALPGNTSDAFTADAAKANAADQSYGANLAGLMSNIDAAHLQRQQEGRAIGDLGIDLGTIDREAQGQNYLDQLRLRGIRRNPWLDAFSQAAGGAAGAMASYGVGTGTDTSQGVGTLSSNWSGPR